MNARERITAATKTGKKVNRATRVPGALDSAVAEVRRHREHREREEARQTKRTALAAVSTRDLQVHAIRQQLKSIIDMAIGALALVDMLADAAPNAVPTDTQLRPPTLMGHRRQA